MLLSSVLSSLPVNKALKPSLINVFEGWITSTPGPRSPMHKFSFVPALGSFCSNYLFYFWWLNNNLSAVPCCVYHMLLWFTGSINWILLFPGKQGNPLYCSATLPIYPVCVERHTDGCTFQIQSLNVSQWGAGVHSITPWVEMELRDWDGSWHLFIQPCVFKMAVLPVTCQIFTLSLCTNEFIEKNNWSS